MFPGSECFQDFSHICVDLLRCKTEAYLAEERNREPTHDTQSQQSTSDTVSLH